MLSVAHLVYPSTSVPNICSEFAGVVATDYLPFTFFVGTSKSNLFTLF